MDYSLLVGVDEDNNALVVCEYMHLCMCVYVCGNVMDYSLLVGVDEDNNALVVCKCVCVCVCVCLWQRDEPLITVT